MKRVCAWCQLVMEGPSDDSGQITHGICPACFDGMMAKVGNTSGKREDRDGDVIEINS